MKAGQLSRRGGRYDRRVANYRALAAYLENLGTLTIKMSFAEVEAITGKLPPSARAHVQWWGDDPTHSQAREGWLVARYETTTVSMKRQTLAFARASHHPSGGR